VVFPSGDLSKVRHKLGSARSFPENSSFIGHPKAYCKCAFGSELF